MDRIHIPYNKEQGVREDLEWVLNSFINIKANNNKVRKILTAYKAARSLFFKIIGLNGDEKKVFLQRLPKGTPLWVPQLAKIFPKMSTPQRRYWSTVLFSPRLITLPPSPDYSSITMEEQPSLKAAVTTASQMVGKFWNKCGIRRVSKIPDHLRLRKWHFSVQAGPNGRVLSSMIWDAKSLSEDQIKILSEQSGPKMLDTINFFRNQPEEICNIIHKRPSKGLTSRKIAVFSDMEGKTRIIGELDYFSQASLKPLHHYIFRLLRSIPQDYTFNQDGAKPVISGWEEIYSCDLKTATDRFPISMIQRVLSFLPQSYVNNWKTLMVDLPFRCPDGIERKYQTGNPMGAYSSWSTFALAHHYIVMYACELLKMDWRKAPYILLGDDIAFGNRELYMKYREIIFSLGVEVSEQKTHESKTFGEFAKRIYYKGEEITPFPLRGLRECHVKVFDLANLFFQEMRRGYFSAGGTPAYVRGYQKYVSRVLGRKDLPSKYDSSKLLATASTVCYRYQKREKFLASMEVGKIIGLLNGGQEFYLSDHTSKLILFTAYWGLIDENADKDPEAIIGSNLLQIITHELRDPESDGPWDPEKLSPWWELASDFEELFNVKKEISYMISNLPSDPEDNFVPRLLIKHLGAPSPEANFSLSERRRELLVAGRAAKRIIAMLNVLISDIHQGDVDETTKPLARPDFNLGMDDTLGMKNLRRLIKWLNRPEMTHM